MANRFEQLDSASPSEGERPTPAERSVEPVRTNRFEQANIPSPKRGFTDWGKLNTPFGELKPGPDRTPTEQLKSDAQDTFIKWGADPYNARWLGDTAVNLTSMTPIGSILAGADLQHNVREGNYGAATLDAIGTIPGVQTVRRATSPMPQMIPANVPPPWIRPGRPSDEAGRPVANAWTEHQRSGWTTPSQHELERGARTAYRFGEQSPVEYHPDSMRDFVRYAQQHLQSPNHGRGVFTPEAATELYDVLNRVGQNFPGVAPPRPPVNLGFNPAVTHQPPPPVPRAITPTDYDTLRQQLRSLTGPSGAGGHQVADLLDAYMLTPHARMTRGTQADVDALRQSFREGRGNWRSAKTSEGVSDAIDQAVHSAGTAGSGFNTGNRARQKVGQFVTSDAGQARLPGVRADEVRMIEDVASGGSPVSGTNLARHGSNLLGGGGGMQQQRVAGSGFLGGGGLGLYLGLDPITSAGVGALTGGALAGTGAALRHGANQATLRQAENVAAQVRRNSPLFEQNLAAAGGTVDDPRDFARSMIAMALMPQIRESGTKAWNEGYVPYENRDDLPRITVRP